MPRILLLFVLTWSGTVKSSAQLFRYEETCSNTMLFPFRLSGVDMEQDEAGRMYFATVDGIETFDGFRTQLFRLNNARFKEPQPQYVISIYIDQNQQVWAGLRNGLARLDPESGTLIPVVTTQTKARDDAFPLLEDADGFLWVDTYDGNPERGHATRYHPGSGAVKPYYFHLPDGRLMSEAVRSLHFDDLGFRCITATGSYQIRTISDTSGSLHPIQWPGGASNGQLHQLLGKDGAGNYWALDTIGRLFWGKNLSSLKLFNAIPEVSQWRFPGVTFDRMNRCWIYTHRIAVFDPGTNKGQIIDLQHCETESYPNEKIHQIFHDRQNVHWLTPGLKHAPGVVKLLTEQINNFGIWEPPKPHTNVFSIYREPGNGHFWVGTYASGAYQLDSEFNVRQHFDQTTGTLSDRIIFLTPAGNEQIWLNAVPKGISMVNKRNHAIKTFKSADGKPYQECFLLGDGKLLIAAYNHFSIFDPSSKRIVDSHTLPTDGIEQHAFRFIQSIEEDGQYIWMGGYDKRIHTLNRLDGSLSTIRDTFIQHNVMCLKRRGDSLYVGTLGQGLAIYNIPQQRFVANFMAPEGFPHHAVYAIKKDAKNRLWLFSSSGLTMYEPEKGRFQEYGSLDGMPWAGFNSGGAFQAPSGYLYGCGEGILWFHPDSLRASRPVYNANISIIKCKIGEKNFLNVHNSALVLAPDENYFEITFSNFDYGFPRVDTFWYKLEGLDSDWHRITEPRAVFSRIPPGKYVFKVRGANRFGVQSEKEDSLHIHIRAWWWQQPWFWTILLLLTATFLWIVSRSYLQRKKNIETSLRIQMQLKSLEALRGQLDHHFVKNTLGRANAKLLGNNIEEANRYLGQLAGLMELVLLGSKADFYLIKQEIEIMRLYLDIQSKRWPNVYEFEIIVDPKLDVTCTYIPSLMLQPLVENAIEHGLLPKKEPPRQLTIHWELLSNHILCHIQDTGVGIQEPNERVPSTRIGWENTKSRLEILHHLYQLDLRLEISSPPHGGTHVMLTLPLLQHLPTLTHATNL